MFIRESGLMFRTFAQLFLFKMTFSRGAGGVQNALENPEGWGVFFFKKMEIPERWGGLTEIPSVVGTWIFSGTTKLAKRIARGLFEVTSRNTSELYNTSSNY